jgi:hypothetical protein
VVTRDHKGETYLKIADRNVLITVVHLPTVNGTCNTRPKPLVPIADRILMADRPTLNASLRCVVNRHHFQLPCTECTEIGKRLRWVQFG